METKGRGWDRKLSVFKPAPWCGFVLEKEFAFVAQGGEPPSRPDQGNPSGLLCLGSRILLARILILGGSDGRGLYPAAAEALPCQGLVVSNV